MPTYRFCLPTICTVAYMHYKGPTWLTTEYALQKRQTRIFSKKDLENDFDIDYRYQFSLISFVQF